MTENITTPTRGIPAIEAMFTRTKADGRAAFLPYFPIGYPNLDESIDAIVAMAGEGVDGFEIGVPFSDPLADGRVIQAATQKALENGTTLQICLDAVKTLRARGIEQPMLMMTYVNPILAYGAERFVEAAKAAGADGIIVPDLPPEEGAALSEICARMGMALVFFLAPTSSNERIALVAQHATGFIYVVSLTGVTGERRELPPDLTHFIDRVRAQMEGAQRHVPLVMGFGISQPEQARRMNDLVEGFIVGSALVKAGGEGVEAVRALARSLHGALQTTT